MKLTRSAIPFLAAVLAILGSACDDTGETSHKIGASCTVNSDCDSDLCINSICLARCTKDSCGKTEICTEAGICQKVECSDVNPCTGTDQICVANRCVIQAECSETNPCADAAKLCIQGRCVDPECSAAKPCAGDKVCKNGICADPECSAAKPCVSGTVCKNGLCVEPECSASKKCPAGDICKEGVCIQPECSDDKPCTGENVCIDGLCIEPECSASKPCADKTKVCRNNKCEFECSDEIPCTGKNQICVEHVCTYECSDTVPCADKTKVCRNNKCEFECTDEIPCTGENQICVEHVCTYECSAANPCIDPAKVCRKGKCEFECSETVPCTGDSTVCLNGRCVEQPPEACTAGSCKNGMACGEDGACFQAECSPVDHCKDGKFCQNGKCVTRDKLICYRDEDCGEGYGCDQKKCVPANSCSLTRTCPEGKICRDGICGDPIAVECGKSQPCTDETQTCVRGKCVTCTCKENETCTADGKCVKTDFSDAGKVTKGDPCDFKTFKAHCDGNRKFSCVDSHVSVEDCGSRICGTAPEEGLGCFSACSNDEDFYGECKNWGGHASFTKQCSKTAEGDLVWSLQHGFSECLVDCQNGRCSFTPPEFGESCSAASYPDACQGDWLTYCYYGRATGTACSLSSDAHFCALPSESAKKLAENLTPPAKLMGICALSCSTPGKATTKCVSDADGNKISMRYLCATTTEGKLADFEAGYTVCTGECSQETGLCI